MELTKPGWTVRDHIFGKRKPPKPDSGGWLVYPGVLIVVGMLVGLVWIFKTIWMAV